MTETAPDPKATETKATGTNSAPNPKTGSADAGRSMGGHSKDASHKPGQPAEYVEGGTPKEKGQQ